jgi:hypothetical protein
MSCTSNANEAGDAANGRVSRLLTLLALYHPGHNVGRYISLERIVEQSKESYYEALQTSSVGWHDGSHDIMPGSTIFCPRFTPLTVSSRSALKGRPIGEKLFGAEPRECASS